jgi:hypothetical protein
MRDKLREPEVVYLVGRRITGALKGKLQDYKGTFADKRAAIDACTDPTLTFYEVENTPEAKNKHIPGEEKSSKIKGKEDPKHKITDKDTQGD